MLQYYNEMYGEYPLDGVVDGISDFEYSAEDDPYYDFVGHVFEEMMALCLFKRRWKLYVVSG